jgi:hypothetical protein
VDDLGIGVGSSREGPPFLRIGKTPFNPAVEVSPAIRSRLAGQCDAPPPSGQAGAAPTSNPEAADDDGIMTMHSHGAAF